MTAAVADSGAGQRELADVILAAIAVLLGVLGLLVGFAFPNLPRNEVYGAYLVLAAAALAAVLAFYIGIDGRHRRTWPLAVLLGLLALLGGFFGAVTCLLSNLAENGCFSEFG